MGRPKQFEPRSQQLNISLTVGEWESVKRRAHAVGMRPVHFGRAVLLETQSRSAASPARESTIQRLVYAQLVRLGNNLNQLVRRLHRTGEPLPADLEPLLQDIRQILDRRVTQ